MTYSTFIYRLDRQLQPTHVTRLMSFSFQFVELAKLTSTLSLPCCTTTTSDFIRISQWKTGHLAYLLHTSLRRNYHLPADNGTLFEWQEFRETAISTRRYIYTRWPGFHWLAHIDIKSTFLFLCLQCILVRSCWTVQILYSEKNSIGHFYECLIS